MKFHMFIRGWFLKHCNSTVCLTCILNKSLFKKYKTQDTRTQHPLTTSVSCYCTITATLSEFYSGLEFWTRSIVVLSLGFFFPLPCPSKALNQAWSWNDVYTILLCILESSESYGFMVYFIWLRSHRCWVWWTVWYPDSHCWGALMRHCDLVRARWNIIYCCHLVDKNITNLSATQLKPGK